METLIPLIEKSGRGSERNRKMAVRAISGESCNVLAKEHGIGGERVRQIVCHIAVEVLRPEVARRTLDADSVGLLEVGVRANNCLRNMGIETVTELRTHWMRPHPDGGIYYLLGQPNFGRKTLKEVMAAAGLRYDSATEEPYLVPIGGDGGSAVVVGRGPDVG